MGVKLGLFWVRFHQVSNYVYFHKPLLIHHLRPFERPANWLWDFWAKKRCQLHNPLLKQNLRSADFPEIGFVLHKKVYNFVRNLS
jgi:hypothetical protein